MFEALFALIFPDTAIRPLDWMSCADRSPNDPRRRGSDPAPSDGESVEIVGLDLTVHAYRAMRLMRRGQPARPASAVRPRDPHPDPQIPQWPLLLDCRASRAPGSASTVDLWPYHYGKNHDYVMFSPSLSRARAEAAAGARYNFRRVPAPPQSPWAPTSDARRMHDLSLRGLRQRSA